MPATTTIRPVEPADLDWFFQHQQDLQAVYMAAFTSKAPADRAAFDAHWKRLLASESVIVRTILEGVRVIGHIARYEFEGRAEITYWIAREAWGRGHASRALEAFLEELDDDEVGARVAADNAASRRVLEKCGFQVIRSGWAYANGRGEEIDELIYLRQRSIDSPPPRSRR